MSRIEDAYEFLILAKTAKITAVRNLHMQAAIDALRDELADVEETTKPFGYPGGLPAEAM